VATNPREVDDDVEVADEALLDAGCGGRGAQEEAPPVLGVDKVLGVNGAKQARLVLLQRLPQPVVRVRALPGLEDAPVAGLLLLVVFRVFAPAGGRGWRIEPAVADLYQRRMAGHWQEGDRGGWGSLRRLARVRGASAGSVEGIERKIAVRAQWRACATEFISFF
jgi:hypothetical protein